MNANDSAHWPADRDDACLTPALAQSPLRAAIDAATRLPEPELLPALLDQAQLSPEQAKAAHATAIAIASGVREKNRGGRRTGLVQGLLQEFALSSQEGVALMCLAEALLRIPDAATRDALIRDKIVRGDWRSHVGQSPSLFVNAATWGLVLTGRLAATHSDEGLGGALARILGRGGEPMIRAGVDIAMRMLGEQFVMAETIERALEKARSREAQGLFRHSYDMLGEAALTERDAQRYLAAYEHAIDAIGDASAGRGIHEGAGVSIKLSALHPRYGRAQIERVRGELYPRLLRLAERARRHDVGFNIDAEESDRLALSLELLERLCFEPALAGWSGIGFVIQAYQKRCPAVIDWLVDLARRSSHRLMVRLVKGAYWDSEIKRAQLDGLDGYPVYTRKAHTDVAYIACARRLLAASDAIYPQFATHNAQTIAAVHALAAERHPAFETGQYEFQCLHGMGEPLYEQVAAAVERGGLGVPCRIYAPVGTHETLLAYLVRRLLENGANTSFVNRMADEDVALEELVQDPVQTVRQTGEREGGVIGLPHPAIALPRDLYGEKRRKNSRGLDLAHEPQLAALDAQFRAQAEVVRRAAPMLAVDAVVDRAAPVPLLNPADRGDQVGSVQQATLEDVEAALAAAVAAAPDWADTAPPQRAARLEAAADRLEADTERLVVLLAREAGKTCANAVAEVREAVDFLRYYARQIEDGGWDNATHRPLGPVLCISPWNFPLAIFCGQIAAALAAGNVVLAKPAEQTPLVAAEAVRALHDAGVPRGALQLLPGPGETIGAALVADPRVQGVLFTGSTEVARLLQRTLARRLGAGGQPVPLVAETGGQNAMIVDSSALVEQVVADVVTSAFDSAGQRCSALRVLCLQREMADACIEMLTGAMRELRLGDPRRLATDVGPVIDAEAKANIERHLAALRAKGRRVVQPAGEDRAPDALAPGTFVAPALVEIESLAEIGREVFGPVLHVLRWDRVALSGLLDQIDATGYGLTLGVHSRIDETVAQIVRAAHVGNIYVNRNVVGAVVGVQPFGGEGLSGTGPKAGGPLYPLRLLATQPRDAARRAAQQAGIVAPLPMRGLAAAASDAGFALRAFAAWAADQGLRDVAAACEEMDHDSPLTSWRTLTGPTGQADLYAVLPRDAVLCLADRDCDRLLQLAAVLAAGGCAVWSADAQSLWRQLPLEVRQRVALVTAWTAAGDRFDAVLHAGDDEAVRAAALALAERSGPIVGLSRWPRSDGASPPLARLVLERSLTINTAAAGGNAGLMTIG